MRYSRRKFPLASLIMLFVVACIRIAETSSAPVPAQTRLNPTGNPIQSGFFGMHIHHMVLGANQPTPWPAIPFGSWRLWDAYAAWPSVEPEKGKWNFANVDKYVSLAEEHHVEILMPLALSPTWASSRPEEKSGYQPGNAAPPARLDDWRDYVRTVATRYKGKVHYYEVWNEANEKPYYTGTLTELATLVAEASKVLKEVDPSNKVVSPSFVFRSGVSAFDEFLKAGGGRYVDVIGFHFYVAPNPPEAMIDLVLQVKALMAKNGISNKQLWNTESGWAIANNQTKVEVGNSGMGRVLSESEAEANVARANILMWGLGVSRFYYYAWDNKIMGLTEEDGKTLKAPAIAYAQVEKWLVGAVMLSCASNSDGTWVAELSRQGNYHGWIVWNPDYSKEFRVPADWRVQNVRDLKSGAQKLNKDLIIQIGPTPILLENTIL